MMIASYRYIVNLTGIRKTEKPPRLAVWPEDRFYGLPNMIDPDKDNPAIGALTR